MLSETDLSPRALPSSRSGLGSVPLSSFLEPRFHQDRFAAFGQIIVWPLALLLILEGPIDGLLEGDGVRFLRHGFYVTVPLILLVIWCVSRRRQPLTQSTLELGPYTLERKIGEGGMGQIYRGWHTTLRRPVAIKVLTGTDSEAAVRRFEREVLVTARLTHPNTISVYDYGRTSDGRFYYAMELLDGTTLQQLVAQAGPQPSGRVIHILLQLCGALREAHDIGLIHCDITPSNVHLCSRGGVFDVVKVLDFGLVRECGNAADFTVSGPDAVMGTPLYLSPEAILAPASIDARADIYGIGAVGYFLLCGSAPFSGASLTELLGHHLHSTPVAPSERATEPLAKDLERLVLRCLAKAPAARPQTVQAVADELRRCRDAGTWSEAIASRPPGPCSPCGRGWTSSSAPDSARLPL